MNYIKSDNNLINIISDTDFVIDKMLDRLFITLVGYESHKAFLAVVPHERILDMAAIIRFRVDAVSYAAVTYEFLSAAGCEWSELYEKTLNHMQKKYEVVFDSMLGILRTHDPNMDYPDLGLNLYVLTHGFYLYGSAVLLYDDILHKVYDKVQSDYFIIPANVNELLICPEKEHKSEAVCISYDVRIVNSYILSAEDNLTDSLYLYDSAKDKLEICEYQEN